MTADQEQKVVLSLTSHIIFFNRNFLNMLLRGAIDYQRQRRGIFVRSYQDIV